MQDQQTGKRRSPASRVTALAMLLGGAVALSACVSVKAPDKPIVIELNINIKQEVVYRLAADANKSIEARPDLFGN
ncbi:MAG: YnbE family lipoprotein [Novosphingobium sp.]|nr:YnbE family lipoprotein [Novosphingobium sp.]MBX9642866.1 YnbE family lipoprotein [Novosphingobium sp.]